MLSELPNFQSNFLLRLKVVVGTTVQARLMFPGFRGVNQQERKRFLTEQEPFESLAALKKQYKLLTFGSETFLWDGMLYLPNILSYFTFIRLV